MSPRAAGVGRYGALAATLVVAAVGDLGAQGRLVGYRSSSVSVLYEHWSFSQPLPQPTPGNETTVLVDNASEISFPVAVTVPLGENWSVDVATAFSSGRVVLAAADTLLDVSRYTLNGIADTRLRATGKLSPMVSLTFGLNIPTGKTSLDAEEYNAFRVLAAPALSFQIPRLGSGVSGTAGVVLSRQLGPVWAGALGVSYEVRGSYDAGTLVAALASSDYSPGDALRISAGLDGLVGQHGMTLGLSADIYPTNDVVSNASIATRLGPVLTADWQLRVATTRFRELTLYAVDRYRTRYRSGLPESLVSVTQSSGNYLDAGVRSVLGAGPATGVLAAVNFRHQTGLKADDTFATAGMVSGALTLGLIRELGGGYVAQPFVRGQIGQLKTGTASSTGTGVAAGLTVGLRF
jgi:hypothetical protein